MTRDETLKTALDIVSKENNVRHGNPEDNFKQIARLWTSYLNVLIQPKDVALMMILLKIARVQSGHGTDDNFIDIAGYAACASEISSLNKT